LVLLFRKGLALSEWVMKQQQWTVTRRQAGHPAAERQWDRAYQLLLAATAAGPGVALRRCSDDLTAGEPPCK
jgi:hypothetical protein